MARRLLPRCHQCIFRPRLNSDMRLQPPPYMPDYLTGIQQVVNSELLRVVTTASVLLVCLALSRLWARWINHTAAGHTADVKRGRLVWSKNVIWTVGVLVIFSIWGSKLAGFALSVAALAGAVLIVSKELLVCVLGYFLIAVSRPYRIGDFIEISGYGGRVVDIDLFFTTLAETGTARQLTGKTVALPNSLVISTGVRNLSATGEYIVDLYTLILPFDCDFAKAEACALEAAERATVAWRGLADAHFHRLKSTDFIDLPSSRPKVLWEPLDAKAHGLTIRFSCPIHDRVSTEQEIFRQFWARYLQPSNACCGPVVG